MAESVDALVSNTCGRKAVPVRPRLWVQRLDTIVSGRCCSVATAAKFPNLTIPLLITLTVLNV